MIELKQRCLTRRKSGISKSVQQTSKNDSHLTIVLSSANGRRFLSRFLERYEELLQDFDIQNPQVFAGHEVDAFIALSNMANRQQSLRGEL